MSKEELKKLKTWNGKAIHTEDVRKVFSILKALLKLWGHKSYIAFGDTPPGKDKCIEMIHQLFDEYADNKYMATVERKFQLEEHTCSRRTLNTKIELLEIRLNAQKIRNETLTKDNKYLLEALKEATRKESKYFNITLISCGIAVMSLLFMVAMI